MKLILFLHVKICFPVVLGVFRFYVALFTKSLPTVVYSLPQSRKLYLVQILGRLFIGIFK